MKAVVLGNNGAEINDVPEPQPKSNEVLVRVHAAALNRADIMMADGMKHGNLGGKGSILGLEWAGEVCDIGDEVRGIKVGDRVMCSGSGGYAEYAATDWGRTSFLPEKTMSFMEAATLPIALQTMHDAIVTNGQFQSGETILIQGASSGVGLMGIQLAKYLGARLVIAATRDPGKRAKLKKFGADIVIDPTQPEWSVDVLDHTEDKGVDLIIDQVSGGIIDENMKAAALQGRIINVGRLGGFRGSFDHDLHALKRISYLGVTFRTRSLEEVRQINKKMRTDLWQALEEGRLRLPIDRSFPLEDVKHAHEHMRNNSHFGKVILVL
jgi:NADPH2:quinone reductase